jgi:N-acetyl-1-D-myo-inositol-2-amino-2-deoxy-alpha-D-glucopyranoside deacetylase
LLGVDRAVTLGYRDSGLVDWPQAAHHRAFINADVSAVASQLTALFDAEQVKVVVTYDENGYYGHPDHIHTNRVAMAAARASQSVRRVLYPVTPRRVLEAFLPAAKAKRVFLPGWVIDAGEGIEDEHVAVTVDAVSVAPVKQRAIAAHVSQVDNADLQTMDPELFELLFGHEYYQLGWSRDGVTPHSTDLMGGIDD